MMLTIYISILGGVLFLLLFGESSTFEGTPVQTCHYLLTVGLFEGLEWGVGKIFGAGGLRVYTFVGDACCNRPNPFMQLFYLALLGGSYYSFGTQCFNRIPGPFLSAIHSYAAPVLVLAGLWAFAMTSFSDPGVITRGNVRRQLSSYPYDGVIYEAESICATCQIPKPARSKHCGICNRCVARFDHHCGWMNNCIGEKNLRYFLLFLFLHAAICLYGGWLLVMVLAGEVQERHLLQAILDQDRKRNWRILDWLPQVVQWLLIYFSPAAMLLLLASVVALLMLSFLGYHLFLVWGNTTTNETFKWEDYKRWRAQEAMTEAEAQAKEMAKSRFLFAEGESSSAGANRAKETKKDETGALSVGATLTAIDGPLANGPKNDVNGSLSGDLRNRRSGWRWWPWGRHRESDKIWISPSSIRVHNIYDRGLCENTLEVLWPPGVRPWDEKVERKRGKRKIG